MMRLSIPLKIVDILEKMNNYQLRTTDSTPMTNKLITYGV
jgi:hypothetical protein